MGTLGNSGNGNMVLRPGKAYSYTYRVSAFQHTFDAKREQSDSDVYSILIAIL
jgi:hypothetical protein